MWDVMRDRGYAADERKVSLDALSVCRGRSLDGYRQTLDLPTESASTEQLREALIRHRTLFRDLTGLRNGRGRRTGALVGAVRGRTPPTPDNAAAHTPP